MNHTTVIIIVFTLIISLSAAYLWWTKQSGTDSKAPNERFSDGKKVAAGGDGSSAAGVSKGEDENSPLYKARVHVIRTFKEELKRKPTSAELDKYAVAGQSLDSIRETIKKDHARESFVETTHNESCSDDGSDDSSSDEGEGDSDDSDSDSDIMHDDAIDMIGGHDHHDGVFSAPLPPVPPPPPVPSQQPAGTLGTPGACQRRRTRKLASRIPLNDDLTGTSSGGAVASTTGGTDETTRIVMTKADVLERLGKIRKEVDLFTRFVSMM